MRGQAFVPAPLVLCAHILLEQHGGAAAAAWAARPLPPDPGPAWPQRGPALRDIGKSKIKHSVSSHRNHVRMTQEYFGCTLEKERRSFFYDVLLTFTRQSSLP